MKSTNELITTLKLDEKEAYWLKLLVSNPIKEDENLEDKKMRDKLYSALPDFYYLSNAYTGD